MTDKNFKKQNKDNHLETPNQHLIIGHVHLENNNIDAAIKEYKKAVDIAPRNWQAHYMLAGAYIDKTRCDFEFPSGEKKELLKAAAWHCRRIILIVPGSEFVQKANQHLKECEDN